MPLDDLDAVADVVLATFDRALAPILERIAAAEARLSVLGDLRDRVVSVEAKAAMQPVNQPVGPIDLTPTLERLAAAESQLATLCDVRDRLIAVETKAAMPTSEKSVDLAPVLERVSLAELKLEMKAAETVPIITAVAEATKDLVALRERVAVAEVRAFTPGPAGKDGINGKDGADGFNGFGLEDFSVDFDGDRTILLTFERGAVKKTAALQLPYLKYQALYEDGRTYVKGDVVTWGGHMWHCEVADSINKKPGESKDWLQCVQRGREGKAGRDGRDVVPLPVLTAGGGK